MITTDAAELWTFVALALAFTLWERLRPAREVNWRMDLALDCASFAVAVGANRLWQHGFRAAVDSLGPAPLAGSIHALQALPSAARIVIALVLADFCLYWIHRAQHRLPWLWPTHAWHHSAQHLYWLSGCRGSVMHACLYAVPQTVIPFFLLNLTPWEAAIAFSIGIFVQFWEHTNLEVDLGPLRRYVVTPNYHRVHHSASPLSRHNLAPIFPVWDRMFGTYVEPRDVPERFPLGLGEPVRPRHVPRMMLGV